MSPEKRQRAQKKGGRNVPPGKRAFAQDPDLAAEAAKRKAAIEKKQSKKVKK